MNDRTRITRTILYGLIFLLFFQLVSDFIETIYAFGLLGTNIPPQIASILFFLSPLVLLFFKRSLPRQAVWILPILAALARSVEVAADTGTKMVTSGLGVGSLLLFFPVWLTHIGFDEIDATAKETGFGLLGAISLSTVLRVFGAGSDLSLQYPWVSWLFAGILIGLVIVSKGVLVEGAGAAKPQGSFGSSLVLAVGVMGGLAVLYFGFVNPLVMARWSGVDSRLIIGLIAAAWVTFAISLSIGWPKQLAALWIWGWNALFLAAGAFTIAANQVFFPTSSASFPIEQPVLTLVQQVPLFILILLSPVVVLDLILLIASLKDHQPAPRKLAGGVLLASFFFLVIILGQVFTTVYDYIPVVGPWFRDRFWLVFTLAGIGMAIPAAIANHGRFQNSSHSRLSLYPAGVAFLCLGAFVYTLSNQPVPVASTNGQVLRVVTYNIQQGYSANGQRNYQGQLDLIRSLNPDVVGLEESDVARFSGGNADIVRTISEGLGMYSYYGPRTVTGTFGIALLSRYPLENPHTIFMYSTGEQTAAIEAQITVDGKQFTILVTHLGNGGPMIQQQEVLTYLKGQTNIVAMGDFNFEPDTPQYKLTLKTLADSWVLAGSPLSSSLDPAHLIDHIFVSPGMGVTSASYVDFPASDHPALLVEITQ